MRASLLLLIPALLACSAGGAGPSAPPGGATPASHGPVAVVDVVGVEYLYRGLPRVVRRGTAIEFRNDGREPHEIVVFQRNDGVSEDLRELLARGREEALAAMSEVGHLAAMPGQAAEGAILVEEPGAYIAVCFIALGAASEPPAHGHGPDASDGPGPTDRAGPPAHYVEGMLQEFTVD